MKDEKTDPKTKPKTVGSQYGSNSQREIEQITKLNLSNAETKRILQCISIAWCQYSATIPKHDASQRIRHNASGIQQPFLKHCSIPKESVASIPEASVHQFLKYQLHQFLMCQLYQFLRCQLQKHAASQETWSINRAKIQISWSIILSYYHCVINQTESDSMVPHVTESFPNLGVLRSQSLQQQLIDTICSNQQEYVCLSALNVIMIATAECKPNFCSWSIPFHRRWEELIFHFCKWGRRDHMKQANLLLNFTPIQEHLALDNYLLALQCFKYSAFKCKG